MPTNKPEVVLPEDLRLLIVCDTQFGWNGQTTLKVEELERLAARGWLKEGIDYYEYEVTEVGRKLINDTLTRPADGEFVLVPREPTEAMQHAGLKAADAVHRGGDYPSACWNAMLSAAPQQPGQEVGGTGHVYSPVSPEEEAAIDEAAGFAKVTLRLPTSVVSEIDRRALADGCVRNAYLRSVVEAIHQQPAEALAEYQYRKPGAHDDSWHRMTREEYEASLATGHCCGIASWTKNFELRKLYTTTNPAQQAEVAAVDFDGTDSEVLREFIRLCREVKPVGQWPGERVCAAIERSMANEKPFRFIAEADMAPERGHNGRGGDADRLLSAPRRSPPPAIDIGKLRAAEPNDDAGLYAVTRHNLFVYEVDFGDEGKGRYVRLGDFNKIVASYDAACEPFVRHNSSEQFIDIRVPTSAVTQLRALIGGKEEN